MQVASVIELVREADAPQLMLETLSKVHQRQWQDIVSEFQSFSIKEFLQQAGAEKAISAVVNDPIAKGKSLIMTMQIRGKVCTPFLSNRKTTCT